MSNLGFAQKIYSPTRITETSSTLIDNIFTNETNSYGKIALTDISDHLGTLLPLPIGKKPKDENTTKKEKIKTRQITTEGLEKLNNILLATEWDKILQGEDKCKKFYDISHQYSTSAARSLVKNQTKKLIPLRNG